MSFKKTILTILTITITALTTGQINAVTLSADTGYDIELRAITSEGEISTVVSSTANATTNSSGKIVDLELTGVPTHESGTNFILINIFNEGDTPGQDTPVVRGLSPAPCDDAGEIGINQLATTQTDGILKMFAAAEKDHPILTAFGTLFFRVEEMTATESNLLSSGTATVLTGLNGFLSQLENVGFTSQEISEFQDALVCNENGNDLGDYTSLFKESVEESSSDTAKEKLGQAAGIMGDIIIAAATEVGMEINSIIEALDRTGVAVAANEDMQALENQHNSVAQKSMEISVGSLFIKFKTTADNQKYRSALQTLGATGELISKYNTAIEAMRTAHQTLDEQFIDFYLDPENITTEITSLVASEEGSNTEEKIAVFLGRKYTEIHENYQTGITASTSDITTMKSAIKTTLNIPESENLPEAIGKRVDINGFEQKWSIPMVVAFTWVADNIDANTEFYQALTRTELPLPGLLSAVCSSEDASIGGGFETLSESEATSKPGYCDSEEEESNVLSLSFKALMNLREDLELVQHHQWDLYISIGSEEEGEEGGEGEEEEEEEEGPSDAERLASIETFNNRIETIINKISGGITAEQKKALVDLLLQPEPGF